MKTEKWIEVVVVKRTEKLGHGFVRGQVVYAKQCWNDRARWVIYNGSYASRTLTVAEMIEAVKTHRDSSGRPIRLPDSAKVRIEKRLQHSLTI